MSLYDEMEALRNGSKKMSLFDEMENRRNGIGTKGEVNTSPSLSIKEPGIDYAALKNNADFGKYSSYDYKSKFTDVLTQPFVKELNLANAARNAKNGQINSTFSPEELKPYLHMTDEQYATMNYLANNPNYGARASYDYLRSLSQDLNKAAADVDIQKAEDFAEAHPVLGTVASVGANLSAGVHALDADATKAVRDFAYGYNPSLDVYDQGHRASYISDAMTEKVTEGIDSNVGKFLYGTGTSMLNSAAQMALFGPFSTVIMGTNAFASRERELKDMGASDTQAFIGGALSGAIEYLTEKVSVEHFLKAKSFNSFGTWMKETLKQMFAEGSEEFFSDVLNTAVDHLAYAMGGVSDYENWKKQYAANGGDEQTMFANYAWSKAKDIGLSFLGGAISGGVMGNVSNAMNYGKQLKTGSNIIKSGRVQDLMDQAAMSGHEDFARLLENPTKTNVGYVQNELLREASEKANAKKASAEDKTKFTEKIVDYITNQTSKTGVSDKKGNAVHIESLSLEGDEIVINAEEGKFKLNEVDKTEAIQTAMESTDGLNENAKKAFIENYEPGENLKAYSDRFDLIYTYGLAGDSDAMQKFLSETTMDSDNAMNIFKAGMRDKGAYTAIKEEQIKQRAILKETFGNVAKKGNMDASIISFDGDVQGKVNFEKLDDNKKSQFMAVSAIKDKLGLNITWFNSEGRKRGDKFYSNGFYEPSNNTIYLDINATNSGTGNKNNTGAIITALSHELVHWAEAKSPELYSKLRAKILDTQLRANEGLTRDLLIQNITRNEEYSGLSDKEAIDEVMARSLENALSNTQLMEEITSDMTMVEKADFWTKVKDFFKDLVNSLKSLLKRFDSQSTYAKLIERDIKTYNEIVNMYEELLRDASEVTAAVDEAIEKTDNKNAKFSKKEIIGEKGSYGIGVFLDTNIFEGIKLRDWGTRLGEYVEKNYSGKSFFAHDGEETQEIFVADSKERMKKDNVKNGHRVIDKLLTDPNLIQRLMAAQANEVIETSRHNGESDDNSHGKFDLNGWEFRKVYLEDIKGNIWEAQLNIAKGENRNTLYFFNQVKKIDKVLAGNVPSTSKGRGEHQAQDFGKKIPQIKKSVKDSEGNNLTEAQENYFKDSAISDKDGKLKVMYHGTNADFTVFNPFISGGKNGVAEGYGLYFSDSPDVSDKYGSKVMKGYLNIKNPASKFERKISKSSLAKLIKATCEKEAKVMLEDGYESISDAVKDTWISNYVNTYEIPIADAYKQVASKIMQLNENDFDAIQEVMSGMGIRSYDQAYDFYDTLTETIGVDGFVTEWTDANTDEKAEIALAFNSNQFKNVDNLNPTTNEDIRYSTKDSEYLELAKNPEANRDELQKMVEKAARENGYNSPLLYHGTNLFGFTKIDVSKSDDGISFFATDSETTAKSYSFDSPTRAIRDSKEFDYEANADEANKKFYDAINDMVSRANSLVGVYNYLDYDEVQSKIDDLLISHQTNKGWSDVITDYLTDVFYDIAEATNMSEEDIDSGIDEFFDDYINPIVTLGIAKNDAFRMWNEGTQPSGIYSLYSKTDNLYVVDAKNSNWNKIRTPEHLTMKREAEARKRVERLLEAVSNSEFAFDNEVTIDGLIKDFYPSSGDYDALFNLLSGYQSNDYPTFPSADYQTANEFEYDMDILYGEKNRTYENTRSIAEWAKDNGYDGVEIKNVVDDGGRGVERVKPATVYIFFNPQSQVKSADPITYDDNGEIIPLSQRFNPNNPDIRYSYKDNGRINSGTFFSGGGTVDYALRKILDHQFGVEFNKNISMVYRDNLGNHVFNGDVRDFATENHRGNIEYFHASPVCKDYSKAKNNGMELPLDLETARATAKAIRELHPPVVTIENVPDYAKSRAISLITDALEEMGYKWDMNVFNSADYGAYTSRDRLIIRAVAEGELPPLPEKTPQKGGWYEAVEDLIPSLEETHIPDWMLERLENLGINYKSPKEPLFVFGNSPGEGKLRYAYGSQLMPTITANKTANIIFMPDGRVLKDSPRILARITGLDDDYKLPSQSTLARTIVGNGIPVKLTQAVVGPLLKSQFPNLELKYSYKDEEGYIHLEAGEELSLEEITSYLAENASNIAVREEYSKLKKQVESIAKGEIKGAKDLSKYADSLLKDNGSKYDKSKLVEMLVEIQKNAKEGKNIERDCKSLAHFILANSSRMTVDKSLEKDLRNIREELRGYKLKLSENQKKEMRYTFGAEWTTVLLGKVKLSNTEGITLDEMWSTLSSEYPFLLEADVTDADQGVQLADLVKYLYSDKSYMFKWSESEERERTEALGKEIAHQLTVNSNKEVKEQRDPIEAKARYDKAVLDYIADQREKFAKLKEQYNERTVKRNLRERIINKATRMNDKLVKNDKDNHIPEVLKQPLLNVLNALQLQNHGNESIARKFTNLADALEEVMTTSQAEENLNGYFDSNSYFVQNIRMIVSELNANMDNFSNKLNGEKSFKLMDLSVDGLRAFNDVLTAINRAAYNYDQALSGDTKLRISERGAATRAYLKSIGEKKSDKNEKIAWIKGFLNWDNVTQIYAFDRFGEGGKTTFKGIMEGQDKLALNTKQIVDYCNDTFSGQEYYDWSNENHEVEIGGHKYDVTTTQLMSLYALYKRKSSHQHLFTTTNAEGDVIEGQGIVLVSNERTDSKYYQVRTTEADIKNLIGLLTDRQKAVADKLQNFMNTVCSDWGNYVTMKRFGILQFGEENYFPMQVFGDNKMTELRDKPEGASLYSLLNQSFTKSLNNKANGALELHDFFSVFLSHANGMATYNAMGLPVLDVLKWMNYTEDNYGVKESVQTWIRDAYGTRATSWLKQYLVDINGNKGSRTDIERGLSRVITKYKTAAVAANLRVALMQPTAYIKASIYIDPKYLAKAFSANPKTLKAYIAKMNEKAPLGLWKTELGMFDLNIGRSTAAKALQTDKVNTGKFKDKANAIRERAMDLFMKPAEIGDSITWGALYHACELEIMDTQHLEGAELDKAVNEKFRETCFRTQVFDSINARSQVMRNTDQWHKLISAFASEPTLSYSMLSNEAFMYAMEARTDKAKAWKNHGKKIGKTALAWALCELAVSMVAGIPDFIRDDDETEDIGDIIKTYFKKVFGNYASDLVMLPWLRDAQGIILDGFDPSRPDEEIFNDLATLFNMAKRKAEGKDVSEYRVVYNVTKFISHLTGIPLSNVVRGAKSIINKTIVEWMGWDKIE